jgi:hypothetical protein
MSPFDDKGGMMTDMPNLHAQTLARAAVVVGGADVLAQQFDVTQEMLGRYIRGESVIPSELFLRATEIVTQASVRDAAKAPGPEPKRQQ